MFSACALLLFRPLSLWFLLVYAMAGLTDLLDGFFARRFHAESSVGARLDSAADFLLCAALLFVLLPYYHWPLWIVLWIAGIGFLRIMAALVCFFRFRTFAFLHTYSNKATGILLFLFPFLLWLFNLNITSILLCSVASLSALEEFLIQLSSATLNLNRVSLFSRQAKTPNIQ
jgi:CDP-diacylglycerol--glycerol-3-phosphate 3-phosphatidyltransferase